MGFYLTEPTTGSATAAERKTADRRPGMSRLPRVGAKTPKGVPTGRPILSTKYLDEESGLYYYGRRFYAPTLGRWVSRDPAEETSGASTVAFCANNPLTSHDYIGLWLRDVHETRTIEWAQTLGIDPVGASTIGYYDNYIDTLYDPGATSGLFNPIDANLSWHFNRNLSGPDSRDAHASVEFRTAELACGRPEDDALAAARHLGYGLHPLQDKVAHGEYLRSMEAPFLNHSNPLRYIHNRQGTGGTSSGQPDDASLDANDRSGNPTPTGVATVSTMTAVPLTGGDTVYWTTYSTGPRRLALTRHRTEEYLRMFKEYVRLHSIPHCLCWRVFLGQTQP